MIFFELEPSDISNLNDADLREMVARLCEAELVRQDLQPSCVLWGGAQEAADGGLDVRITKASLLNSRGFIQRENTGFQVKKNSMSKAACKSEMLENGKLKAVIYNLVDEGGAYVIVSGKDDCSDKMLSSRLEGMKSALNGITGTENFILDFYGRDRLCAWLRQYPGVALWVRSRLGKPLSGWQPFGRWAATPLTSSDQFLQDDYPCVFDINSKEKDPISISDGIKLIREKLCKPKSVVRITGLSGVGKTRIAQALFETDVGENSLPKSNVIYADLGDNLNPTASELISYLTANYFSSYVVLDNCPPDVHRRLQKRVSSNQANLSLLTIEYDISDDRPEETDVIHIEPSSEKLVSKLIQTRFPSLGLVNANKVSEFSGGNARVAIALASRVSSDETLANFSDEDLFKRLFYQRKDKTENLLENAEVLSLVYSFNVSSQEFNDELSVLSTIGGLERSNLNRSNAELLRRQLSQQRGNWRAILPHALANRLARRALQNIQPDQINSELLQEKNKRLFISCAHRLGYLHDFEPARQLANTWLEPGGPFNNITSCDDETLSALDYIAPVFPGSVLFAIENASQSPDFCSRKNTNVTIFVRLLRKIAYEEKYFDQAAELIVRFALTENRDEKNNSIVGQLSSLFSLHLSGTLAKPTQRQAFLNDLLSSKEPRKLEIAHDIFHAAFEASYWTSFENFDFGAHIRDYGWEPKTDAERLEWYTGFIDLLIPILDSSIESNQTWAKEILANHFRALWNYAHCFDYLDKIIRQYASAGKWPNIWIAIKKTIEYNGEKYSPELLARIKELESISAPSDPYSEIEAYVFTNIWELAENRGGDYTQKTKDISLKIEKLGELTSSEPEYLEMLAPKLWKKHFDSLYLFGKGLAKGSSDQKSTFSALVRLMQNQALEIVQPVLFNGFIAGVHESNPSLSRKLQESVLDIPQLKPYFVNILTCTPIVPWGINKLIDLARSRALEAWRFEKISFGRIHESITDNDLSDLLLAVNELEHGVFTTIQILTMRFHNIGDTDYTPSDELLGVGRQTILKLLSIHQDEIERRQFHGMDSIMKECFSRTLDKAEIQNIVDLLCEGLESYRLYQFELESIITGLVKYYPEYVLDRVFINNENPKPLSNLLFEDRADRDSSLLNLAPVERILNWCDEDQDRIQQAADSLSAYSYIERTSSPQEQPEEIALSRHVLSLLDVAKDKVPIVDTIFARTFPSGWSDSPADILEKRSEAFKELLNHESSDVRKTAEAKLVTLERNIKENRGKEAEKYNWQEQTFE